MASGLKKLQMQKRMAALKAKAGTEIAANDFAHLEQQMETFKNLLSKFSKNYQERIKKDAEFRRQFVQMCASLGVDPLASNKTVWGGMSGVSDFYYELAVQAIEICMATRDENGGLIELETLFKKLVKSRGSFKSAIILEDLKQALKNLKILGSGFQLIQTNGKTLVQSIPSDMGNDPAVLLNLASENGGFVSEKFLIEDKNWDRKRAEIILNRMLHSSQAWLDVDDKGQNFYYFPSLMQ